MAMRLREKNVQVFILAPLKGHEFRRACHNIDGEFIQISPASHHCINIMEIRKTDQKANICLDGDQRAERSGTGGEDSAPPYFLFSVDTRYEP